MEKFMEGMPINYGVIVRTMDGEVQTFYHASIVCLDGVWRISSPDANITVFIPSSNINRIAVMRNEKDTESVDYFIRNKNCIIKFEV